MDVDLHFVLQVNFKLRKSWQSYPWSKIVEYFSKRIKKVIWVYVTITEMFKNLVDIS